MGYIQSSAWSPFSLTLHSPVAHNPDRYGIRLHSPDAGGFARHIVPYEDPTPYDRDLLCVGLRRAGYHYNRGLGLDRDVRSWFSKPLDPPGVPPDLIRSLAPPDGDEGVRHRQPWRTAGADWTDRPRHGFQAPDCVVVGADGGDLVLIDFSDDSSYRFEGIGAECWRLLAEGLAVTEIVERLAATYSVPRERVFADVSALIDELCESGLLRRNYEGRE